MPGARSALIIGGDDYSDPGLQRLRAPASDARALARVLEDPAIGGFAVRTLLNEPAHVVSLAVEEFFADRVADDLLLLHFSCHGVKDEDGELYFAMANTVLRRLAATAVPADFVNRRMNRTRSRRVVLLLDCCYAGAFERGMTARAGSEVGIESQFGGRGRAVITASSAMEYAFEGEVLADAADVAPSVFTSALVEGLETGDADRDQDGLVALDELYDYIYDRVRTATPNQTPGKWTFGVQGELVIARRARPVTQAAPLPAELVDAIDSRLASVRAAAVQELERLLRGKHAGRALAARQALRALTDDDSRTVAAAAAAALAGEDGPVVPAAPVPAPQAAPEPESAAGQEPEPAPEAEPAAEQEPESQPGAEPDSGPAPAAAAEAETSQEPQPAAEADPSDEREPLAVLEPEPAAVQEPEPAAVQEPEPAPEPAAAPPPGPAAAPSQARPAAATSQARPAGMLAAAALLSAVSGVLVIWSLFPAFATYLGSPFALGTNTANTRQATIAGLTAIVAAVLIAVPRTRWVIGPAVLIGAATEGPNSVIYDFLVGRAYAPIRTGLWLNAAGGLALTIAAVLAGVVLARTAAVRAGSWVPAGLLARLIALIGLVSAVVLVVQVLREATIPGTLAGVTGRDMFPLFWSATMTAAVPLAAMIVLPRAFGIALLAGGLANDAASATFYTTPSNSAFAIPVAVLIVLTVALAVTGRQRDRPVAPDPPARAA